MTAFTMADYPSILVISLCYQYVSRNWYYQQALGLAQSIIMVIYCSIMMPESPKYLYMKGNYDQVREFIYNTRKFNGIEARPSFNFDAEVQMKDNESEGESLMGHQVATQQP